MAKASAKSKTQTSAAPKKAVQKSADPVRFVLNEDGAMIYATNEFYDLAALPEGTAITGRTLADFIAFSEPDDVFRTQGLFGAGALPYYEALNEGVYKAVLCTQNEDKTEKPITLQLDKIDLPDGRRLIIGSEIPNKNAHSKKASTNKNGNAIKEEAFDSLIAVIDEQNRSKIAAKKETEAQQKISRQSDEAELRHFLNMSNDMIAISFRDSTFSRVNTSFNRILGYTDPEFWAMQFIDLVHPDDRPYVRSCLVGMMHDDTQEGHIVDFEARVISKEGETLCVEWRQKRVGNTIYTVGRDITATKRHEQALKRQQEQLAEAQSIGHMGHWYWTVGGDDIEWSREIYRIFGVSQDEFKPTMDSINAMLHRRDLGRMMQAFQRAIIEQNNYEMEFQITRPDGEERYILCEGKCETDDEGDVIALFGIMQDITERTLYERDLKQAKDAAERAYAAKSQFLANMSHELRTPLNAIIGFSEMMQRQLLGPIGTEKYLDYIGGIRESGEHLLDLISDILDMSKIEAGKYELDLEEFNLAKSIRLAVHMIEGRALDAQVKIYLAFENEDLQIIADRRAFMQILLNLLSNAVKFTEAEGEVHLSVHERDDYISIKVQDNGIGIPANKLRCITNPFEQAASHYTRKHEGTGLGLAITKDLVELHGGTLHIESAVGIGTTVSVRLPYDTHAHTKKKKQKQAAATAKAE